MNPQLLDISAADVISQPDYINKSRFNEHNKTLLGDLGGWKKEGGKYDNHGLISLLALSNPGKELTLDGLSEGRGHCLVDFLRGRVWGERGVELPLWDDYGVPGAQVEHPPEHIVRLYSRNP